MDIDLKNLENLQVAFVKTALEEAFAGDAAGVPEGLCTCEGCLIDIVALALNSLPPRYVADKYYKFPDSAEGEDKAAATARRAVKMALRRVANRPHHDR